MECEIQRQLTDAMAIDIGHAGSKGTHLSYSTFQPLLRQNLIWPFGQPNWSVNGITTLQTGFPLATATNQTGSQGGGSRPNVVPGVIKKSMDRPRVV
jgi:hypothetical protein